MNKKENLQSISQSDSNDSNDYDNESDNHDDDHSDDNDDKGYYHEDDNFFESYYAGDLCTLRHNDNQLNNELICQDYVFENKDTFIDISLEFEHSENYFEDSYFPSNTESCIDESTNDLNDKLNAFFDNDPEIFYLILMTYGMN